MSGNGHDALEIRFFGPLEVVRGGRPLLSAGPRKTLELLSTVVLTRDRGCEREVLATLLWPDSDPEQSKKYLRQALWQIHTAVDPPPGGPEDRFLLAGSQWIRVNPAADLWLDVELFDAACRAVVGVPGSEIGHERAAELGDAMDLYRGDFMAGWYQDWCLVERERLQNLYLLALDKLAVFHEAQASHDQGIACAQRILRIDPANERSHRRLMHLYWLLDDRSSAIRQFERCRGALREDLGVDPSSETLRLYERIRASQPDDPVPASPPAPVHAPHTAAREMLDGLRGLETTLAELQQQVQSHITMLSRTG